MPVLTCPRPWLLVSLTQEGDVIMEPDARKRLTSLIAYKIGLGCDQCGVEPYCGGRCPVQVHTGGIDRARQYCFMMREHVRIVKAIHGCHHRHHGEALHILSRPPSLGPRGKSHGCDTLIRTRPVNLLILGASGQVSCALIQRMARARDRFGTLVLVDPDDGLLRDTFVPHERLSYVFIRALLDVRADRDLLSGSA